MKVLIDEDLPQKLRHSIKGHELVTVGYAGWLGLKNGRLLRAAEDAGFRVLLTGDQNLTSQQNMKGRLMGVVVVSTLKLPLLLQNIEAIEVAIGRAYPESYEFVLCR